MPIKVVTRDPPGKSTANECKNSPRPTHDCHLGLGYIYNPCRWQLNLQPSVPRAGENKNDELPEGGENAPNGRGNKI